MAKDDVAAKLIILRLKLHMGAIRYYLAHMHGCETQCADRSRTERHPA